MDHAIDSLGQHVHHDDLIIIAAACGRSSATLRFGKVTAIKALCQNGKLRKEPAIYYKGLLGDNDGNITISRFRGRGVKVTSLPETRINVEN